MKKFITSAALLAASTALASAATVLQPEWTTLSLTAPANGTLTSSNSGFTWAGTTGAAELSDSWKLSFNWASTNTASSIQLFSTRNINASGQSAAGLILNAVKSGDTYSLTLTDNAKTTTYATVSIGSALPSTATTVEVIYIAKNDGTNADLGLSYNGTTTWATTIPTDYTSFTNASTSGSGTVKGTSRLWTNGGKDKFTSITLSSGSAIPEPSAFGLLAGIGALALAVSRRRRSR